MYLQACLSGSRTPAEHPDIPLTPDALAAAARAAVAAGADALHVHPRDEAGLESLAPDPVAAALTAIRDVCPRLNVGISTAAYLETDVSSRIALLESWTVLPDFVSLNLSELGAEQVAAVLMKRGVGLEAGIWTVEDAHHLRMLEATPWLRFMLEPWETDPEHANRVVDSLEKVLHGFLPDVPRLLHGTDGAAWALLQRAGASGYQSRIGFEDTLLLPSGDVAPDNAALVRAARELLAAS